MTDDITPGISRDGRISDKNEYAKARREERLRRGSYEEQEATVDRLVNEIKDK